MLRSTALSLLSLTLLASPAIAQTAPARKAAAKPAPRMVPSTSPAARAADPLRGTSSAKGQSGYAAPGEPIISPKDNGKNTPPYGPAAGHGQAKKSTTLAPK